MSAPNEPTQGKLWPNVLMWRERRALPADRRLHRREHLRIDNSIKVAGAIDSPLRHAHPAYVDRILEQHAERLQAQRLPAASAQSQRRHHAQHVGLGAIPSHIPRTLGAQAVDLGIGDHLPVRAFRSDGELPAVRIGRSVRFSQESRRAWVSDRTGGAEVQAGTRPNAPVIDLDTAFRKAGFDKLGTRFSTEAAVPALRRLADAVKDADPLFRQLVQYEAVRRLTRAGVRKPAAMVKLAMSALAAKGRTRQSVKAEVK